MSTLLKAWVEPPQIDAFAFTGSPGDDDDDDIVSLMSAPDSAYEESGATSNAASSSEADIPLAGNRISPPEWFIPVQEQFVARPHARFDDDSASHTHSAKGSKDAQTDEQTPKKEKADQTPVENAVEDTRHELEYVELPSPPREFENREKLRDNQGDISHADTSLGAPQVTIQVPIAPQTPDAPSTPGKGPLISSISPLLSPSGSFTGLLPPVNSSALVSPGVAQTLKDYLWDEAPQKGGGRAGDQVRSKRDMPRARNQSQRNQRPKRDFAKEQTCSLNLRCYRSGASGGKLELAQINTTLESRYPDNPAFRKALQEKPELISTDQQFFRALREGYSQKMTNFWRRAFSLKTLRELRLLSYQEGRRPRVVPLDEFILQEMLTAYNNPSIVKSDHKWIEWVFRLRQYNRRHAVEFVEGWNGTRILFAGMVPWLISTLVGILWTARGGDTQTAFTVAGFILTSATLLLALLAIISGIESSGQSKV